MIGLHYKQKNASNFVIERSSVGVCIVDILLGERFVTNLHESLNDNLVVIGGVQAEEALEKVLKIGFGEDLSLKDHLKHGFSKILVRVLWILLNRNSVNEFWIWFSHVVVVRVFMICVNFGEDVVVVVAGSGRVCCVLVNWGLEYFVGFRVPTSTASICFEQSSHKPFSLFGTHCDFVVIFDDAVGNYSLILVFYFNLKIRGC